MSKNLTRKGLALGAVVALGSTLFAGTSAFAAGEINVAPSAGTSYNAVAGTAFNLATTFAPGFTPSSYAQLKYSITTDANSAVTYDLSSSAAVTAPSTSVAASTTVVTGSTGSASATTVNYLGLKDTTTSVTSSVQVTAFVDANNNGALDAGEWNTVRTVTFKKLADITPVVTLSAPKIGDTSVSATVAWGDLNTQQAGLGLVANGAANSKLGVEFKYNTGSYAAATAYNTTTLAFSKSQSVATAGDVVSAQAVWATNPYTSSTNSYSSTALGTAVSGTAAARTINTTNGLVANVLAGNDAVATSATAIATNTAATVRTNGTFTAQVKAYDTTSTTALAAPSVAVVGTVALGNGITLRPATSSQTEISVTVNGTKYTDNTALSGASFALTTDSTGVANVVVSSVGVTAGSTATITVSFAAQNLTAAVVATETDATYSVSESNPNDVYSTTPGSTTALNYSVKDQFGQAISGAYRVKAVATENSTVVGTYYVNVAAGKATVNVADAQLATATSWYDNSVVASLEVQNSTTSNWSTQSITAGDTTVIHYTTTANNFSTAPALADVNGAAYSSSAPTKQSLATAAYSALVVPTSLTLGDSVWARLTLAGTNVGENYTVSAPGLAIWANGKVNLDSATVQASGSAEAVYVASNKTGTVTVTFTTGAVTNTVAVVFDKSVAVTSSVANAGAVVALGSLATASQAGRSVDVSATIVDKFGNPLQGATVTLSSTGVGYLANTTTTSDANGKVTGKLIVGALENGDAVVTASATLGDATTASAAKTITFGATDAQIDIVGNRVTATASYTAGKTVSFYVDGIKKWSKLSSSDADLVINSNLKKGTHTVSVKISGGFVTTEKFIVK
jgi:trimeric autotransporter adhesin